MPVGLKDSRRSILDCNCRRRRLPGRDRAAVTLLSRSEAARAVDRRSSIVTGSQGGQGRCRGKRELLAARIQEKQLPKLNTRVRFPSSAPIRRPRPTPRVWADVASGTLPVRIGWNSMRRCRWVWRRSNHRRNQPGEHISIRIRRCRRGCHVGAGGVACRAHRIPASGVGAIGRWAATTRWYRRRRR